jgi:hypothetical protein
MKEKLQVASINLGTNEKMENTTKVIVRAYLNL